MIPLEIRLSLNEEGIRSFYKARFHETFSKHLKQDLLGMSIGMLIFLTGLLGDSFTKFSTEFTMVSIIGAAVFLGMFIKYANYRLSMLRQKRSVEQFLNSIKKFREVKIEFRKDSIKHCQTTGLEDGIHIYPLTEIRKINKYDEGIFMEFTNQRNILIPKTSVNPEEYRLIEKFLDSV